MAALRTRPFLPVGPLLLIGLGILLLLQNLGLVSPDVWWLVARLWPLGLVLLGVQALLTGRMDWSALILLLAAVAVLSLVLGILPPAPGASAGQAGTTSSTFEQSLDGASSASVTVRYGASRLEIGHLDEPGLLARGSLTGYRGAQIRSSYQVSGGHGDLEVQIGARPDGFLIARDDQPEGSPHTLRLDLTGAIPLDLNVDGGLGDARLDLRDLQVRTLQQAIGASRSEIILPAQGQTRAVIRAGAASIRIEVPEGVAARIQTSASALSRLEINEARFPRQGSIYESPEYASASNRAEIILQVGAASVEID